MKPLKDLKTKYNRLPTALKYFFQFLLDFNLKMAVAIFKEVLFYKNRGYDDYYISNVLSYLKKDLSTILKKYKLHKYIKIEPKATLTRKNIWVLWWQGYSNMPDIVKACYHNLTIECSKQSLDVVLITKNNYKEYLDLPFFIERKFKKGIISFPHLSDIIRNYLIAIYGGIWIDATIFVTPSFACKQNSFLNLPFYTQSFGDEEFWKHEPSKGKWSSFYFVGDPTKTSLFSFLSEAHTYYWKKHKHAIHYVLMDYILMTAYTSLDEYRTIVDSVGPNNERVWDFVDKMNDIYKEDLMRSFLEKNDFYKLTYKDNFVDEKNGKLTFYGYLISLYKNAKYK